MTGPAGTPHIPPHNQRHAVDVPCAPSTPVPTYNPLLQQITVHPILAATRTCATAVQHKISTVCLRRHIPERYTVVRGLCCAWKQACNIDMISTPCCCCCRMTGSGCCTRTRSAGLVLSGCRALQQRKHFQTGRQTDFTGRAHKTQHSNC